MGFLLDLWGFLAPLVEGDERGVWSAWFRVSLFSIVPIVVGIEWWLAYHQLQSAHRRQALDDVDPSLVAAYSNVVGYQLLLASWASLMLVWFLVNGPFEAVALIFYFAIGFAWNRLKIRRDSLRSELGFTRLLPFKVRDPSTPDNRPYSERMLGRLRGPALWGSELVPGPSRVAWAFIVVLLLLCGLSLVVHGANQQFEHLASTVTSQPSPYDALAHQPSGDTGNTTARRSSPRRAERPSRTVDAHLIDISPGDNLWTLAEEHCPAEGWAAFIECWMEWQTVNKDAFRSGDPNLIFPSERISNPEGSG